MSRLLHINISFASSSTVVQVLVLRQPTDQYLLEAATAFTVDSLHNESAIMNNLSPWLSSSDPDTKICIDIEDWAMQGRWLGKHICEELTKRNVDARVVLVKTHSVLRNRAAPAEKNGCTCGKE